ncbi:MAG: PxKF domain-containing protein [Acidobacteriota bacterium]
MKLSIGRSKMRVLIMLALTLVLLAIPVVAVASDVDASVVDATAPTGSVTLAPGASSAITINLTVTGNQVGTATFDVYRNWTLSGGTFSGSNPQTFTVYPRTGQDPATTFSTSGTVTVASGQGTGIFTLAVGAFNITNSNDTGGKLKAGASSNYQVTVSVPTDTTPPTASPTQSPVANLAGWNKDDVTVIWNWTDNAGGAGIDSANCTTSTTSSGEGTITLSAICYDLAQNKGNASYTVKVDKTAPTISASAKKADNTPYLAGTWTNQTVTVHFTCDDTGGSGVASCPPDATYGTDGKFSAGGTVTDNAGNSASTSFSTIQVDKTPPSITFVNRTLANSNGWNNGDVTVNWSCTDNLSGVVAATTSKTVATEGSNQSATGTCTDNAGNNASNTQTGINIDKTPPTITFVNRTPANTYGWNNGDVTVNWSCADSLSGVVAATASKTVATEGTNQSAIGTCTDNAGNSASNTQTGINIDKTAPSLSPSVSPNPVLLNGTATASPNATDNLSGVASSSCDPVVTSTVGPHTVNCSATDQAGNSVTVSTPYSVIYKWSGFLPPITADGKGLFKLGSTVPVKFQLFDFNNVPISTAVAKLMIKYNGNSTLPATEPFDASSTSAADSGNIFRFDLTGQLYIFNWGTKGLWEGAYTLSVILDDGTTQSVGVNLRVK